MAQTSKIRSILPVILALPFWLAAGPACAEESPMSEPPSTLTVRGSAEIQAEPDLATVRLGILAQEKTARAAQDRANTIASAILEALQGAGVEESAIRTSELRLHPVYSSPQPRPTNGEPDEPRIVAYRASNVVTVRLEDLGRVGPVIDAGLGAGANRLEGVQFQLEDDTEARSAALTAAVTEARAKARTIAAALEVELVGVHEVQEGGVSTNYPRYGQPQMMMAEARSGAPSTPVSAGTISVSAEVTVVYRISGGSQ